MVVHHCIRVLQRKSQWVCVCLCVQRFTLENSLIQLGSLKAAVAMWRPSGGHLVKRRHCSLRLQKPSAGKVPSCWGSVSPLSYSGLQWIGWGLPTLSRTIFFTQSPLISVLISSENTLAEIHRMFDHIPGQHGPAKLTHNINHLNHDL